DVVDGVFGDELEEQIALVAIATPPGLAAVQVGADLGGGADALDRRGDDDELPGDAGALGGGELVFEPGELGLAEDGPAGVVGLGDLAVAQADVAVGAIVGDDQGGVLAPGLGEVEAARAVEAGVAGAGDRARADRLVFGEGLDAGLEAAGLIDAG